MKYEMDFLSGHLTCWNCGEDILSEEGAVLIEWQVGFRKEVNCKTCFAMLLANDKDIKVLATFRPIKDNLEVVCDGCGKLTESGETYKISIHGEMLFNYCSRVCIATVWYDYYNHFVECGFIKRT